MLNRSMHTEVDHHRLLYLFTGNPCFTTKFKVATESQPAELVKVTD